MAQKGDGDDLNRNGNSNYNPENDEPVSNTVRLEPDIGLGSYNQTDRKRRGGNPRRENGSISFSHFLQNDAGHSSSSYPDLYSCSRQDRSNDGPVVDPDSPDLPDFVQDHLAVEQLYFNDCGVASNVNLPDFASFASRNNVACEQPPIDNSFSHGTDQRRLATNQLPFDLPMPNFVQEEVNPRPGPLLPFDLTTNANAVAEARSPESNVISTGGRLPDFLSDGHVLGRCNTRRDIRNVTFENSNNPEEQLERPNSVLMLRQENIRLRDELNVLQSILMKKEDRIKELEDIVMALEISKLQMSSDANTQTLGKPVAEDEVTTLKQELELTKAEIIKLQCEKITARTQPCPSSDTNNKQTETNTNLTMKVKTMTNTSEKLVRELLKIITDMQSDIHENDSVPKNTLEPSSKDQPGPSS